MEKVDFLSNFKINQKEERVNIVIEKVSTKNYDYYVTTVLRLFSEEQHGEE